MVVCGGQGVHGSRKHMIPEFDNLSLSVLLVRGALKASC